MDFPQDLLYSREHEWVRIQGEMATIGITDFAQDQLGDIVYVDIEALGQSVERNSTFGSVEAVKTVSDLFMPLNGTIVEVNEALGDKPELVNSDPYGKGWMIKIQMEEDPGQADLMNAAEYAKMVNS
jgi:glycine cleavage system H protein